MTPLATTPLTPAPLFQDNAVLQRDKPVPVWGTATPGDEVSVSFSGQIKSTITGRDGRWQVVLDPLPACAVPAALMIAGRTTITLSNILVGEVWIASGQSNMEWPLKETHDAAIEIAGSANPLIREIKIARNTADVPIVSAEGVWRVASPRTTGDFSAIAYHFARDIQSLVGVPVGIITSARGSSRAQAWIDGDTLAGPGFDSVHEAWERTLVEYPAAKARHDIDHAAWERELATARVAGRPFTTPEPPPPWGREHAAAPSCLYNAMIHPLVPCAIRGVIWYQGEGNTDHPDNYADLFRALITGWRAKFGQGDFPFYWAQLANYRSPAGSGWVAVREAQTKTLALPATGQVVTIDIGDAGDIHPRNKKDAGRRFARLALARDYGFDLVDTGPVLARAVRDGAGFRVDFRTKANLHAPSSELHGFEVAGTDRIFKLATGVIDGKSVFVTSTEVPEPVSVRYAWHDAPLAGLVDDEGLPAAPFRTDDWN